MGVAPTLTRTGIDNVDVDHADDGGRLSPAATPEDQEVALGREPESFDGWINTGLLSSTPLEFVAV